MLSRLPRQMIKEGLMDKRLGATWHVVVGRGFGFDISYEISRSYIVNSDSVIMIMMTFFRIFYMFFAGNLGICSSSLRMNYGAK